MLPDPCFHAFSCLVGCLLLLPPLFFLLLPFTSLAPQRACSCSLLRYILTF